MSKESLGQNYQIIGTPEYFDKLNNENFIATFINSTNPLDYHGALCELCNKILFVFDEIHTDLSKNERVIRHIPYQSRMNLLKMILGFYDICKFAHCSTGKSESCVDILSLNTSGTRFMSNTTEREFEDAIKIVTNGGKIDISRYDRLELIKRAADNSLEYAANNDPKKVAFLQEVANGKDREFFSDISLALLFGDNPRLFTGKCGRVICSSEYLQHIEKHVFNRDIPNFYINSNGDRQYEKLIRSSLQNIADTVSSDLEQALRNNDYITDANANNLKNFVKQLEKYGANCHSIENNAQNLAWFVGGDPEKIKQLQRKLNDLNIYGTKGKLVEDGVYGKETKSAFENLFQSLISGSVPALTWIDPLKNNSVLLEIGDKTNNVPDFIRNQESNFRYIRINGPHIDKSGNPRMGFYRGNKVPLDYNHINIDFDNPTALQAWIKRRYNHYPLTDSAYYALKDLDSFAKTVQIGGKVLAVGGIALDALELGTAIKNDLTDEDKKLGKETVSTAVSIGGRWALGAIGAKVGAAIGALTGPLAVVAVPVLSITFGVAGSLLGDKLGEWAVDITCLEE